MSNNKFMKYKDYLGSVDFDLGSGVLYGKIQFINDTVTYEASNLADLKTEFEVAVDDYLKTCAAIGKEPQKTYSGTFNIRVGEKLHRDAVVYSTRKCINLNEFCREAIAEKIEAIKSAEAEKEAVIQINLIDPNKVIEFQEDTALGTKYLSFSVDKESEVQD